MSVDDEIKRRLEREVRPVEDPRAIVAAVEARGARPRRVPQRNRVLVAAALVVAVAAGAVAITVSRPDSANVTTVGPASEETPQHSGSDGWRPPLEPSPVSLWLSADRVPTGPVELVAVLVDHGGSGDMFGVEAQVDRWEGDGWVPHGRLSMCLDHWFCTGRLDTSGDGFTGPDIGLDAAPGRPGPVERFTTDGLDPGWYRISHTGNEGVIAAGTIEVADDAEAPPPLPPLDQAAISVTPPLVPLDGAGVQLSPLVPSGATQTAGDIADAVAGLSESAAIERWTSEGWVPVVETPLTSVVGQPSQRSAELPALAEGSYRMVRQGPRGAHWGPFWVTDLPTSQGQAPEDSDISGGDRSASRLPTDPFSAEGILRRSGDEWQLTDLSEGDPGYEGVYLYSVDSAEIVDAAGVSETTGSVVEGAPARVWLADGCDDSLPPRCGVTHIQVLD